MVSKDESVLELESLRDSASSGSGLAKRYAKDFTFGKVLGEGAYGSVEKNIKIFDVYQVVLGKENDTGKEFAIKMLRKQHLVKEKKVKYATTERDILTLCGNHTNIVKLYYTFQDEEYLCNSYY
jgi:3-phosphoinositide dependent protein kinase-1